VSTEQQVSSESLVHARSAREERDRESCDAPAGGDAAHAARASASQVK